MMARAARLSTDRASFSWPPLAWLILALLFAGTSFLAARAVEAVTAPLPALPTIAPQPGPDASILGRFDPFFREGPVDGANLAVTALPISLKGVRFDAASLRGAAFIAGADGVQRPFALGEEVMEGVVLAAVAADHVILDRGGTRESLWLEAVGGASSGARGSPASSLPSGQVAGVASGSAAGVADRPEVGEGTFADPKPDAAGEDAQ